MFNAVLELLLSDDQRQNAVTSYATSQNNTIFPTIVKLYDTFIETWQGDINDVTLAIEIADGIYNNLP